MDGINRAEGLRSTVNFNDWNHAAGMDRSTSTRTIYVNGQDVLYTAIGGAATPTVDQMSIGALWRTGVAIPFDGRINNVIIHSRALLPSEIQQLYADPWAMGRRRPTLVSFYLPLQATLRFSSKIFSSFINSGFIK